MEVIKLRVRKSRERLDTTLSWLVCDVDGADFRFWELMDNTGQVESPREKLSLCPRGVPGDGSAQVRNPLRLRLATKDVHLMAEECQLPRDVARVFVAAGADQLVSMVKTNTHAPNCTQAPVVIIWKVAC